MAMAKVLWKYFPAAKMADFAKSNLHQPLHFLIHSRKLSNVGPEIQEFDGLSLCIWFLYVLGALVCFTQWLGRILNLSAQMVGMIREKKSGWAQARERQADILIGYKRANRWRLNEGCQVFSSKNEECYVFMRILFWGDLNWIIVIIDLCTLQDMVRAMVGVYVGMMIAFLCLFKVRRSKTQKLRAKRRAKPAGAAIFVLCQCLSIFM